MDKTSRPSKVDAQVRVVKLEAQQLKPLKQVKLNTMLLLIGCALLLVIIVASLGGPEKTYSGIVTALGNIARSFSSAG